MGVAGGELLIPTFVLLYAIAFKVAGSLFLAVSLPTMLVAFARYAATRVSAAGGESGLLAASSVKVWPSRAAARRRAYVVLRIGRR
jgi:hypothetical protein